MYKQISVFVLLASSAYSLAQTNDYQSYVDGLDASFAEIKDEAGLLDGGAIYTDRYIDGIWYLPKNEGLREAGRSFLNYLYDNQLAYEELDFAEWIAATERLLSIDQWIGQHVAWGNLVIKAKICNDIIRQLGKMVLDDRADLSVNERQQLIDLVRKLRSQLPSDQAMIFLAFQYHSINLTAVPDVNRLDYIGMDIDYGDGLSGVRIEQVYSAMSVEEQEELDAISEQEFTTGSEIESFLQLYDRPIPLATATLSWYRSLTWDIYFKLLLSESGEFEANTNWSNVDAEKVFAVLDEALIAPQEFWMGRWAKWTMSNEGARQMYLGNIRRDGGMNLFLSIEKEPQRRAANPNRGRLFGINYIR